MITELLQNGGEFCFCLERYHFLTSQYPYKIKNIVSATDGTILKAKLILVKPEEPNFCVNIEISTQVHENLNLHF